MKKLQLLPILLIGVLLFACERKDYSDLESELLASKTEQPGALLSKSDTTNYVSVKKAVEIATLFFNDSYPDSRASSSTIQNVTPITNEDGNSIAYIINNEQGGWVIVSASTAYHPILAYSDSLMGNLEITSNNLNSGFSVWIEEITEAMNGANFLDESAAKTISLEWKELDTQPLSSGLPIGNSEEATKCRERLKILNDTYYKNGWTFKVLTGVTEVTLPEDVYSTADWAGSPYQYTIVGLKDVSNIIRIEPILNTAWNQNEYSPNNYPAGCVTIAMAQIMYYNQWPNTFDWNNMSPSKPSLQSNALISNIRSTLGLKDGDTGATISDASGAFSKYRYSVERKDHNNQDVVNHLIKLLPVYMRGDKGLGLEGHAWVCDGVRRTFGEYEYYVEYLNSVKEYTNYGMTLMENPGRVGGASYTMFHMNWGWDEDINGWFINPTPGSYDFTHNRQNLYVEPIK